MLNGHKCWDMYGWVVPLEELPEVEPLWLAGKDGEIDARFDFYTLVEFAEGETTPRVLIGR